MGNMHEAASREAWVVLLHQYVKPYWSEVLNGAWAEGVTHRRLSLPEMQGWILQLYPFIHAFPKFLAEALIKVEDEYARTFLINNIRVEKAHADHWLAMGEGFGIPREEMLALADGRKPVLRDVQSLTDWLWYINTKGSLAEAVAATSFAIEGLTGDLSRKTIEGFLAYENEPGVTMTRASSRWMREHAHYDDDHPVIALEVVKNYAVTEKLQQKVMLASRRSIQLLGLALDTAFRAYTPAKVEPVVTTDRRRGDDRRADERRHSMLSISFPDRRLRDRRGFHVHRVH
jgi:pyrroloquinoline quinone (PQQ) biosynthesis protein C